MIWKKASIDKAKLARVAAIELEDLPMLRANAQDKALDRDGTASRVLIGPLRRLAVAAYHLDSDPRAFRAHLREAGQIQAALFARYIAREPIDESLVSIRGYRAILDLLASASYSEAEDLARLIGKAGSTASATEFDQALGHGVRQAVLGDSSAVLTRVNALEEVCDEEDSKEFRGYGRLLSGIALRDRTSCEAGLRAVLAGHRSLVKEGGFFEATPDAYVCIWGLGLVNLARHGGIALTLDDLFLPEALLANQAPALV